MTNHQQQQMVPQRGYDVAGCGGFAGAGPFSPYVSPYSSCGFPGPVAPVVPPPGSVINAGPSVFVIKDFHLGAHVYVDPNGVFYTKTTTVTTDPVTGLVTITDAYEPFGSQLRVFLTNGYMQVCGLNVSAGEGVVFTTIQPESGLNLVGGEACATDWSSDGCWCPIGIDCITDDSGVLIEAKNVGIEDTEASVQLPLILAELCFSFIGTVYQSFGTCAQVSPIIPLQACPAPVLGCPPNGQGFPPNYMPYGVQGVPMYPTGMPPIGTNGMG